MAVDRPKAKEVLDSAGATPFIAVNSTATVYSESITLDKAEEFGLFWKASSGGTISLDLEIQMSPDNTNFTTADGMPKVDVTLNDSNLHCKQLPVVKSPYIRFKITGTGSNAATTKLSLWLVL